MSVCVVGHLAVCGKMFKVRVFLITNVIDQSEIFQTLHSDGDYWAADINASHDGLGLLSRAVNITVTSEGKKMLFFLCGLVRLSTIFAWLLCTKQNHIHNAFNDCNMYPKEVIDIIFLDLAKTLIFGFLQTLFYFYLEKSFSGDLDLSSRSQPCWKVVFLLDCLQILYDYECYLHCQVYLHSTSRICGVCVCKEGNWPQQQQKHHLMLAFPSDTV